jgi:molecular chaperone DnaJ
VRKGLDIHTDITVDMVEAALGGSFEVPSLDGRATLKVPPGTQPGALLRLRGGGILASDGHRGDQYVRVHVCVPRDLSERERELLTEFVSARTRR